ncbi:TRIC cation channel family protein [Pseudazoarcus pumilus]|uniref:TRIC cation channel family protein n=1 Tax=Pseudazoarcus pumilus TaxID=2067960 RepID=UPI0013DD3E18|nr:transporter substrate-binding domain-containing protein [Pseudazoarcus pumilus]
MASLRAVLGVCVVQAGVVLAGGLVACAALAQEQGTEREIDAAGRHLQVLQGGWYLWDPYQFTKTHDGSTVLTGVDIELMRAVAREAGFAVQQPYLAWAEHHERLRDGRADIASGATWTAQRAEYVHYSRPYRQETNVFYLRRGEAGLHPHDDIAQMLDGFRRSGLRLGVVDGFAYADEAVNGYISDPANAALIVTAENDYQNLRNLLEKRVDAVIADRLVATTSAWRGGWREQVEEHPLRFSTDIHFIFSKQSVSPEVVQRFDEAIVRLEERGEMRRIISAFLSPILLAQTLDTDWFRVLDIVGTVAFALSGLLIAFRERYSLLGALVLAALPAVGGGAMRDLVVGREPLAVLGTPLYLGLVGATVVVGFVLIRILRLVRRRGRLGEALEAFGRNRVLRNLYELSDAVGIAAFTVTGVAVAVSERTEPLWMWGPLLAMITAAGGGMLRDLVRQSGNIASLKGEFYAEVPLIWGFLLSAYLAWQTPHLDPENLFLAVVATMIGAFVTRVAAVLARFRAPSFA